MSIKDLTYSEGTLVRYWRDIKSGDPSGQGTITDIGEVGGTKVAWIDGCRGCIAFSHIEEVK